MCTYTVYKFISSTMFFCVELNTYYDSAIIASEEYSGAFYVGFCSIMLAKNYESASLFYI